MRKLQTVQIDMKEIRQNPVKLLRQSMTIRIFIFIIFITNVETTFAICDLSHLAVSVPDSTKVIRAFADTLKEVVVMSELSTRMGNEDIFIVTNNMRKGTKNAGELLGKINGVFYNPVTTDMSYLGSKNIIFLVDSVEKDADFIKRLNPGRFDRINIVNMPTGRYQGYDAVINLRTKKNYNGYEGTILAQMKSYTAGRNGEGHNPKDINGAGQYIYTHNKLSIDFYGNWSWYRQGLSEYFSTEYPLNGFKESTLETPFRHPDKNIMGSNTVFDVSGDYAFNINHSISIKAKVSPSWSKDRYNYILKRESADYIGIIDENKNIDIKDRLDLFAGLWYRGRVDKWTLNSNITFTDVDYDRLYDVSRSTDYSLVDNRNIKSRYMTGAFSAESYTTNRKWSYSVSDKFNVIDYKETNMLTNEIFSDGKYIRNTIDATLNFFPRKEFFIGVNAGFSTSLSKESHIKDNCFTPRTGLHMMWNPNKKFSARFNYSTYTSYPAISKMQNYGQFTDSLIWSEGNPRLKAAVVNDFNIVLSIYNMVTLNARYIHTDKAVFGFFDSAFGSISSGETSPFARSSYINGESDNWSLNLTFTKGLLNHWQVLVSAKVKGDKASYENWKSSKLLPEYDWYILYYTMKGSLQFYLSGSMRSYSLITPQQRQWQMEDNIGLSVSKYLLNNRMQIVGMYVLPIHIIDGKCHGGFVSDAYKTQYWGSNQSRQNNSFQISLLYTFNGGKSVKKYNRQSETVEL